LSHSIGIDPLAGSTYDDKQLHAVLVQCAGCGRSRFMTRPQPLCACCRETARQLLTIAESVRGAVFSAQELLEHARHDAALVRVLGGATSAKRVGHRLRALAGRPLGGCRLVCVERNANGRLWAVEIHEATSGGDGLGV
jgi:hypothetical protein